MAVIEYDSGCIAYLNANDLTMTPPERCLGMKVKFGPTTGSYTFRISEEAANYVKPGDLLVRTDTPRNLVRGAGEKFPIVQVTDIGGSVSSEYAKFEGFNITTGYTLK